MNGLDETENDMIKLIASDMDGTLLDENGKLPTGFPALLRESKGSQPKKPEHGWPTDFLSHRARAVPMLCDPPGARSNIIFPRWRRFSKN